jgi:hypothetical protein
MRLPTYALIAVMAIVAATGCSGKSSNDQNSSGSTDASATAAASAGDATATSAAPAATTAAGEAVGGGDVPSYPGATVQVSGTTGAAGAGQTATGKVLSTTDSFDDVYKWYQKNLPAGSEKAHITTPIESAAFTLGSGKNVTSVSISTASGKTMITIAKVSS